MASIITATTTGGLTQSADNSGVLQLASGAGNLVTVPSVTGTAMVSGNMPAFAAWASSSQTLSSGVVTKINFDTEVFDTNSNFASSRFTPTVAGYYQINANIVVGVSATRIYLTIYKNGSAYNQGADSGSSTNVFANGVNSLVFCNGSTDYIEIYGFFAVGQAVFNNQVSSWFNGVLVRGA
jgi:hypothetical protein